MIAEKIAKTKKSKDHKIFRFDDYRNEVDFYMQKSKPPQIYLLKSQKNIRRVLSFSKAAIGWRWMRSAE